MYDTKYATRKAIQAWIVFILLIGFALDIVSGGLLSGLILSLLKGL